MQNLSKINDFLWEIPKTARQDMRVPARIYSSREMLRQITSDKSIQQLMNVATLPGIQSYALVMPDVHEGYGFPIGAVAAVDFETGIISPGGIGYDINCGVRVLKTHLNRRDIKSYIPRLAQELYKSVPSGVGRGGAIRLNFLELDKALEFGVHWALEQGYATDKDLHFIESQGRLIQADPDAVSIDAKERGRDQLGTMGAGNHFVELNYVSEVYNDRLAHSLGINPEQIMIQIHTGSRGLGHQVATDYIREMLSLVKVYGIELPDRELSCAPISSPIGTRYLGAMSAAANFAWTNRQIITHEIREVWKTIFGKSAALPEIIYDVAHNIAKIEEHIIDGQKRKVLVHRKGATRAFPPNHRELPEEYREIGQPVLIPGSMGTASYILAGLEGSMQQCFGSCCHGAGRMMSRNKARKSIEASDLLKEMNKRGIEIQTGSLKGLSEEAPEAYKDVESVVNVVTGAGIAQKIARLKPLAVIKG